MKLIEFFRKELAEKKEFYIKLNVVQYQGKLKYNKYFKISDFDDIETFALCEKDSIRDIPFKTIDNIRYSTFSENYGYSIKNNRCVTITKAEYNKNKKKIK